MSQELAETLAMIAAAASDTRDEWCIIGSAAVVLHGRSLPHVKDVDLLMSAADADAFLRRVGEQAGHGRPNERFRSQVFGTWREPPIPVEVMGGFSVAANGAWREVHVPAPESVMVAGVQVYVPSVQELVRLLHAFDRPKDLERAQLLLG